MTINPIRRYRERKQQQEEMYREIQYLALKHAYQQYCYEVMSEASKKGLK